MTSSKRPRLHARSERLFQPFRALGLVTDLSVQPFVLARRESGTGFQAQLVTCLGDSWAMWDAIKMTLLFVSQKTDHKIESLAQVGNTVWATSGSDLISYSRGKELHRLSLPHGLVDSSLDLSLSSMIPFGDLFLVLSKSGANLHIFTSSAYSHSIVFPSNFVASAGLIVHPATYVNKVVVASSTELALWSTSSTRNLLHTFKFSVLRNNTEEHQAAISITALEQSPAIDVLCVGWSDGRITLFDIKQGEQIFMLHMTGCTEAVKSVAFRTDGEPILAVSLETHMQIWSLAERKLLHIVPLSLECSHIQFLPKQPVLLLNMKNSVQQWLFDSPEAKPRLLKSREGHSTPPGLIRFYGDDGKSIITAGRSGEGVRVISVVRDSRSFELSQGHLNRKGANKEKFTQISDLAFSNSRSKEWDDLLTAHHSSIYVRTWSVQNKRLGKYTAEGKGFSGKVNVTQCGNFALYGSEGGEVGMMNMQSGIQRRKFKYDYEEGQVAGIETDSLNTAVIVATQAGHVHFYDFHTAKLQHSFKLPSTIKRTIFQRSNGLLAVSCDDLTVRLVDLETRKVVREMAGFRGSILDMAFSPDSRWIVVTAMDSAIRTFDIPTGNLVDIFLTPSISTSLSFSPTGEFIATSHIDALGVFLWANRTMMGQVSVRKIEDSEAELLSMPSMQGLEDDMDSTLPILADNLDSHADEEDLVLNQHDHEDGLITLSVLPRSRWQTLMNLDIVKQRNKPKEAAKLPEKAPFFLPTVGGVEHKFALGQDTQEQSVPLGANGSHRIKLDADSLESAFTRVLCSDSGDFATFFEFANALSPSAVDLKIRSMNSIKHLQAFLRAMEGRLKSHRDFEAVQAYLNVFIAVQGEVCVANEEIKPDLIKLLRVQKEESKRVRELVGFSLGTLGFIRDAPI